MIKKTVLKALLILSAMGLFAAGCTPKQEPPQKPSQKQSVTETVPQTPSSGENSAGNTGPSGVLPESTANRESPDAAPEPAEPILPPLEFEPDKTDPAVIFREMVTAYQKASAYTDHGFIEIRVQNEAGEEQTAEIPCLFAFQKPNLARMEMNQGKLVCDGSSTFAVVSTEFFPEFSDTVLENTAPEKMSFEPLFPDHILMRAMDLLIPPNILLFPPQVILLFAKDPLLTFLPAGSETTLLAPEYCAGHPCDRIAVNDSRGQRIFWVRRDNHALVRLELPVELFQSPVGKITSFRIEMQDAEFNRPPQEEAFQMGVPVGAVHVKEFVPPEVTALGNVPRNNTILNSSGMPLKPGIDENKVTVFMLFSTDPNAAQNCQAGVETLKSLARMFASEKNIAFHLIAIDDAGMAEEQVREMLGKWNADFTWYRMSGVGLARELNLDTVPTFLTFDAQGKLQIYLRGLVQADVLSEELRKLLAGEEVFKQWKNENAEIQSTFRTMLAEYVRRDIFFAGEPKLAMAPESEPSRFQREKLWERKLENTCNPQAIRFPNKEDLVIVPNRFQYLSVVTKSGEFMPSENDSDKVRPEGISGTEPLFFVRESLTPEGKRYLLTYSLTGKNIYFLDEKLNTLLRWTAQPEAENFTIGDVRMICLPSEETPQIFVSLFPREESDRQKICRISLSGQTLWTNDTVVFPDQLMTVFRGGVPSLWVIDRDSPPDHFVELDTQGKIVRKWVPAENASVWKCTADDLDGDGNSEVCAVLLDEAHFVLSGMTPDGNAAWSYPFPAGNHDALQFEFLTAGDITGDGTKEWILVSADSVIHVVDASGNLVDKFAYGKPMTGLTVVHWDKHPVLIITDNDGISAWQLKP